VIGGESRQGLLGLRGLDKVRLTGLTGGRGRGRIRDFRVSAKGFELFNFFFEQGILLFELFSGFDQGFDFEVEVLVGGVGLVYGIGVHIRSS